MDGTMISLFGDYKHGRRYKTEQSLQGGTRQQNAGIMPTLLPRTLVRHEHRRGKSYPQVEMSRRLRCTATPPPSLESQSLPKISLRGNAARQQRHRGNHSSSKGKLGLAIGIPTIKCRTTQSLPSLSNSNSSGKSTGKRTKKDPQRTSTFDLFQTSRQGRRTAAHSQNFSWDFSPRTEVPKTCMDIENNRLSNHGERNVETSRPVHLYMGVEMMDKLLGKRKGLRSDETLNELIGLPPTKMSVSTSREKKRPQRGDDIQKHETVEERESQDAQQHPRDVDNHQNVSKCREATTKESPGGETHVKTTPQKQPHDGDQSSNKMETETGTASGKLAGEEDHPGNDMEGEFQDEEEEELGGIDDDEGSNVFDECEDDNEEDDGEEIEEDDGEEIGDDDVDSDDEGRGTSQDGDEEDGEQEEEFEDAEDLEDGEAQGDSEAEEVEEEEFEEVGNDEDDDDDDGEEAERQDRDDNDDYDAADDDELGEGQGGDDDDDDDTDNDGDNENDDEEDGKTVGEGEKEEELDELENNDDEDDDMSDGEDDEQ